jgi:hypothetical protein
VPGRHSRIAQRIPANQIKAKYMTDLKHMDIGSRNQRLRETLEGMGLFVLPIFCESDHGRIDYLQVSVAPPAYAHQRITEAGASRSIVAPVPRPQVAQGVRTAEGSFDNVVQLPSVLGK